jgi:ATP synthase protein I
MRDTSNSPPLSDTGVYKIVLAQVVLTLASAVFFYFQQGQAAAEAALYGGGMALFNVWLAQRRVRTAARVAMQAPGEEIKVLYAGAVLRFVFTLGFFIAGMSVLKLPPLPLVAGFALAHLGYLFRPNPVAVKNGS